MDNNILVSVVIPIYNVEKYLERCLISVQNQTYTNFEAIIVNDGSPDNSRSIALDFVRRDKRFFIIDQENKGLGGARNTGYKASKGEYLVTIDSDDWLHPEYIRRMLSVALKHDSDLVICGIRNVREDDETTYEISGLKNEEIVNDREKFMYTARYVAWNKLYRRELFNGIEFPEHMSKQDYACIPRILASANKIVTISDPLYCYLWRQDSVTNSVKINYNILKAQELLEKTELLQLYPNVLAVYFVRNIMGTLLWSMLRVGEKDKVAEIMQRGIEKYPYLGRFIKDEYIGAKKRIFGKLLLSGHYKVATFYAIWYENLRTVARYIKRVIGH